MAVPYEVAISTIHGMFNGSIEKDVIAAVLEANSGHMEKTVECLLAMNGELPAEEKGSAHVAIESQNQIKGDAVLAKVLQDQLFIQQLQSTYPDDFGEVFGPQNPQIGRATDEVDFDFTEKLKQLGDAAKLKIKEFAMKFKKNKSSSSSSNNSKPNGKYTAVSTEDNAEVIEFDSSLSKRSVTSNFEIESEEDSLNSSNLDSEEVPLDNQRNRNKSKSPEKEKAQLIVSNKKKDD